MSWAATEIYLANDSMLVVHAYQYQKTRWKVRLRQEQYGHIASHHTIGGWQSEIKHVHVCNIKGSAKKLKYLFFLIFMNRLCDLFPSDENSLALAPCWHFIPAMMTRWDSAIITFSLFRANSVTTVARALFFLPVVYHYAIRPRNSTHQV